MPVHIETKANTYEIGLIEYFILRSAFFTKTIDKAERIPIPCLPNQQLDCTTNGIIKSPLPLYCPNRATEAFVLSM